MIYLFFFCLQLCVSNKLVKYHGNGRRKILKANLKPIINLKRQMKYVSKINPEYIVLNFIFLKM